jgi:hypothetical protein
MTALQTEQLLFLRVKFGICQDAVIAELRELNLPI